LGRSAPARCSTCRRAVRPQRADHLEQPGDLGGGQRGRGLVHDDDPCLQRQRLGDLHDLLVGDGQPAADPARVQPHAEPPEQRGRLAAHPPPVDAPPRPQWLPAHEDVLRDGQVGEQGRFLVDDRDPGVLGGRRAVQGDRRAVDEHLALVRLVHPGQHLHHRGFARAVLAEQRVRLPRVQVGRPVHHGAHRAK
jgi:hypothetical protein